MWVVTNRCQVSSVTVITAPFFRFATRCRKWQSCCNPWLSVNTNFLNCKCEFPCHNDSSKLEKTVSSSSTLIYFQSFQILYWLHLSIRVCHVPATHPECFVLYRYKIPSRYLYLKLTSNNWISSRIIFSDISLAFDCTKKNYSFYLWFSYFKKIGCLS